MSDTYQINVRPGAFPASWDGLAPILERIFPVRVSFSTEHNSKVAGEIVFGETQAWGSAILEIPASQSPSARENLVDITIQCGGGSHVPFPFRGRTLRTKVGSVPSPLSLRGEEEILATSDQGPVWAVCRKGAVTHFRSAFALPRISAEDDLHGVLNGSRFIEMLPLLHFLRHICTDRRVQKPPLRACFMFDDPNLHWPRYGSVDFKRIAERAERENYHVSFATIPLDGWFTHPATAEIFRRNTRRISLVVHGNNHSKNELTAIYTSSSRAGLLRQAMRRIKRLERSAGVQVPPIMVPPHGACSEEMLKALPAHGFEAACISHGSLRAHNPGKGWTRALGYLQSEVIEGCPVLPRWGIGAATTHTILLAAYLNQAMIFRGHSENLKNGMEVLDELARNINGLGNVCWSDMGLISQCNFAGQMDGTTFRVQPSGRKLRIEIPEGAEYLSIESPADKAWLDWSLTMPNGRNVSVKTTQSIPIPGRITDPVIVETVPSQSAATKAVENPVLMRPYLRRMLTETRDRIWR